MVQSDKTALVIVLVIVVAYLVATMLGVLKRTRLRRIGVEVDAKVTDISKRMRSRSFNNRCTYTFSYTVDGDSCLGSYTRTDPMGLEMYKHGDSVRISCNPGNPKDMMPSVELTASGLVVYMLRLLIVIIAIAVISYFLLR